MKPLVSAAAPLFFVALAACSSSSTPPAHATNEPVADVQQQPSPVLIELFTSQGCSSCPPADSLISTFDDGGDDVIALSFHVDYWNYIGWKDPFSSAAWSERQREYAGHIAGRRVYTPQLVVQGKAHAVGSNANDAKALIKAARSAPPSGIKLAVQVEERTDRELLVEVETTLVQSLDTGAVEVFVAIYENDLITEVVRGENKGRRLKNNRVVRQLSRASRFEPGDEPTDRATLTFLTSREWHRSDMGVVVFARNAKTLEVLAVRRKTLR